MEDITLAPIESTLSDRRNESADLLDSCFNATIILIDLCNSTQIKQNLKFPKWVDSLQDFFSTVTKNFELSRIIPNKYLGDAVLYLIPDKDDEQAIKYLDANKTNIPTLSLNDLVEICVKTKDEWWNKNKRYLRNKETYDNFMSITITIDYGLIFDFNKLNEGIGIDPLGTPVDRCFRLSKYAGKNHIICSKEFIDRFEKEGKTNQEYSKNNFILMNILSPKGFIDLTNLFAHLPSVEETGWILSYKYEEMIFDTDKPLNRKMQTHMLLKELSRLKGEQE